jgi:ribosomal protein S18 acetylase RimI-like enzyme
MLIRRATSLDLPALAALHDRAADELRGLAPDGFGLPPEAKPKLSEITGKFRDMLDDSHCIVLLAEVEGRIAALATGFREEHGDDLFEAPFLTIEYVEVEPEYRGRGIARALIAELESIARAQGLRRIDLLALESNTAARELYASLGYQVIELRLGKVL